MIGLKRNTVKVIPYQDDWVLAYATIEKQLKKLLKTEIQAIAHIGSTAIKGIASKPIIDIVVALENFDNLTEIRQILMQHAYEDRGQKIGGYLFVKREGDLTTHHIHFVLSSSTQYSNYLFFKHKLNTDQQLRAEYSILKQQLAEKYQDQRGQYTAAKNEFINKVLLLKNDNI